MTWTRISLCALLLLAATAAVADDAWVEVRSPNFTVLTDAGEKRGREVALRFEQMRSVFGTLFLKEKVNIPVPLQIIAFRNSKGMRDHLTLYKGKPVPASGLFIGGDDRQFILLDLSAEGKWETVFHEYAHMLLNGNFPAASAWFDEGFAEYFSTMRIGQEKVEIGHPPESAMNALQGAKFLPITTLFGVKHDSSEYNEDNKRHVFYAQSWLLVHYLFDNRKLEQAEKYFRLVDDEQVAIPEAVQRAFGMIPQQLDRELETYYRAGKGQLLVAPVNAKLDSKTFTAAAVAPLDVKVTLADLHLHTVDYLAKGLAEFQEVVKAAPDHAAAHRGLGYGYLRLSDYDNAAQHFRRAAELDSRDPRVHYYSGLLVVRRSMLVGRPPEEVAATRKHLETAIQLDPDLADAYSLLSFLDFVEHQPEAAIEHARRALELSPRNEHYALNLARAYAMGRMYDQARELCQRLKDSPKEEISAPAEQLLAQLAHATTVAGLNREPKRLDSYDAPQWRRTTPVPEPEENKPEAPPDTRPLKFLKGRITAVDCSDPQAAVVTVTAAGRKWTMKVANREKLILIGTDSFSCEWKNVAVAVNYKQSGPASGDVSTLEIQ